MKLNSVLSAIDAVYETTGSPEKWPVALDRIAECFNAKGAVLITQRSDHSLATVVSPALVDAQRDYDALWWRHDFLSHRAIEQGYISSGNVLREIDLATAEERHAHPFYTEFRRNHGLGPIMAGSISPLPSTTVYLSLQGYSDDPFYTDEDKSTVGHILGHCERALLLSCQIDQLRLVNATLQETLALLGCGVFLIDDTGRVTQVNSAGKHLIGQNLNLIGNRLWLSAPEARRALDAAILSALRDTPDDRLACARPIMSPRGPGHRPLVAYVLPLRTDATATVWSPLQRHSVMVVIADLDAAQELDPALIRDYLGITLGEARVASQIAMGSSPRDAAARLGIAEETVRTTLKRIFSKTGITRQSELASTLSRLELIPVGQDGQTHRPANRQNDRQTD